MSVSYSYSADMRNDRNSVNGEVSVTKASYELLIFVNVVLPLKPKSSQLKIFQFEFRVSRPPYSWLVPGVLVKILLRCVGPASTERPNSGELKMW